VVVPPNAIGGMWADHIEVFESILIKETNMKQSQTVKTMTAFAMKKVITLGTWNVRQ
jgi:hypothetical protein